MWQCLSENYADFHSECSSFRHLVKVRILENKNVHTGYKMN